jgi:antitoxin CptB
MPPVDEARRQVEGKIEHARAARRARDELGELRADAGEAIDFGEKRIEDVGTHVVPEDSPRFARARLCKKPRSRYIEGLMERPSMTESPAETPDIVRRKRIRFRCWHRGIKETDLLLGRFADARIWELAAERLGELEELLEAPDWEIYGWVTQKAPPPAEFDTALMRMVQDFTRDNPL